jgi:hypothetical protein
MKVMGFMAFSVWGFGNAWMIFLLGVLSFLVTLFSYCILFLSRIGMDDFFFLSSSFLAH